MTNEEAGELVGTATGINGASAMFMVASLVGALAEKGVVDPLKVAAWADVFASGQDANLSPMVRESVASQLQQFAGFMRALATKPAGGGRG